ncbi:hypothetical protein DdX_18117 [Ditylenchus destructor]|uniref:G-protein coupled receptors family 1 profile domain-containing protein n=1 Tax=Ditylenchus destructor TaxID=166010 RepID=A0AAD4MKH3_9BILA|nr:hypothetical protein DdX_18117 [Ditylenchus destructor]
MIFYHFVNNLLVCLGSIVYWLASIFQLYVAPRLCTYISFTFFQLFKFSGLILAIDRYLCLCYDYKISRRTTSLAFLLAFLFWVVYEYGILLFLTFFPHPRTACHEDYESITILQVLWFLDLVCTMLAFLIDLRTLIFVYNATRRNRDNLPTNRRKPTRDENIAVIGLTIQASIPVFISLPHQLAQTFTAFRIIYLF